MRKWGNIHHFKKNMNDSDKMIKFIKENFGKKTTNKFICIVCGKIISRKNLIKHSKKCNFKN